jgi:hypothetical protein
MTKIYEEDEAKKIMKRKESIELVRKNKKANARRNIEELQFNQEIKRLMGDYEIV